MSSSSSPCAACKLLRRKCTQGCVFAPYFPPDHPSRFANVHKVFGASNVSKLLNDLPQAQREDAVNSLSYEAEARLRDPVYGCVAYISILQFKIKQVRDEIAAARKELAGYIGPSAFSSSVNPTLHHPATTLHHPTTAQYHNAAAQYAAGMGLGVGVLPPHAHQAQMEMPHPHHHQQVMDAQHMAAAVEVAREQDMIMRQAYAQAAVHFCPAPTSPTYEAPRRFPPPPSFPIAGVEPPALVAPIDEPLPCPPPPYNRQMGSPRPRSRVAPSPALDPAEPGSPNPHPVPALHLARIEAPHRRHSDLAEINASHCFCWSPPSIRSRRNSRSGRDRPGNEDTPAHRSHDGHHAQSCALASCREYDAATISSLANHPPARSCELPWLTARQFEARMHDWRLPYWTVQKV